MGGRNAARAILVACALFLSGCVVASLEEPDPLERTLPAHLLWDHPYPDLLVEVDHVAGRAPSAEALAHLESTLRDVTDKRRVVVLPPTLLTGDPRYSDPDANWSSEEVAALHRETFSSGGTDYRGEWGRGENAFLHLLFLNGHGYTLRRTSAFQYENVLAFFPDELDDVLEMDNPLVRKPTYAALERKVIIHEAGHALGLVNNGIPMVHAREAPDSRGHSIYRESPMYRHDLSDFALLDEYAEEDFAPDRFDRHDLQDLDAFRLRGRR